MVNVAIQKPSLIALSSGEVLVKNLEDTASNLANSSSPGFKAFVTSPREAIYHKGKNEPISYVTVGPTIRDFAQGGLDPTGNPLDVAISGPGFFRIAPNAYTRNGRFSVNAEGILITPSGQAVLSDSDSEIQIPEDAENILIDKDGTVVTSKGTLGKIGVFTFEDLQSLREIGNSLYATDLEAIPAENYQVLQGHVEGSNVNSIEQVTKLILVERMYEETMRIQQMDDDRLKKVINVSTRN